MYADDRIEMVKNTKENTGSGTARKLKIIPLGGLGEIGKNLTVLEYREDIVVIDCGLSFPDDSMPGIDAVIPDMTYLHENVSRIRAFLITHGHEDHIGALPFFLRDHDVPVYGTNFTLELIRHKLNEMHVHSDSLRSIRPGDQVEIGSFRVEFIKTGHSIAGAVALAITTPIGTVIHTGDFKVDLTPMDGEPIDMNRFAYYGSRGVLALLSDSTNIERPGHTLSEKEIGKTFEHYFSAATGRVIVASFASNVYRIQQVCDCALRHGRVVCFQGRSMEQITQIGIKLGYLSIPAERIVRVEQLDKYRQDQICVITTGSQGEPMSGLFRMATSTHRLNLGEGDTVIISASAIPGNERGVNRVIDQLYEKGAYVVYDRMADVHVSGHANREELRLMMQLTKPKYFIPVHGEFRHLYMHAELAYEMGFDKDHVFRLHCGDILELTNKRGIVSGSVQNGSVMVDGYGGIDDVVLRDRLLLSADGIVAAVITIDAETGRLLKKPEIVSRGVVYMKENEDLISGAVQIVMNEAQKFEKAGKSGYGSVKNAIRSQLRSYFKTKTKRTPVLLPIITEI